MSADEVKIKICSKCGEELPATSEYFPKRKSGKDGLRGECRICDTKRRKQWEEKNKEAIAEKHKEYYSLNCERIKEYKKSYQIKNRAMLSDKKKAGYNANKQTILERNKKYREANLIAVKERKRNYYELNKEEILQKSKEYRLKNIEEIKARKKIYAESHKAEKKEKDALYYANNKDAIKKYNKEWVNKNSDKVKDYSKKYQHKRRTLMHFAPYSLNGNEWEWIKESFKTSCCYCGKHESELETVLEQEHFIPVTKGGGYTKENIIPACRSCNASKNNKDFFDWYPQQEFYSQERELFIIEHLTSQQEEQEVSA